MDHVEPLIGLVLIGVSILVISVVTEFRFPLNPDLIGFGFIFVGVSGLIYHFYQK